MRPRPFPADLEPLTSPSGAPRRLAALLNPEKPAMNRLKPMQPPSAPAPPAEPPTEPGIWRKLLPDGRVVPWIVLPPAAETDAVAPAKDGRARGCGKCTT